jgi:hypothetical protein
LLYLRTREIERRILPTAHEASARYLATAGFLKEEPPHPLLASFVQNGGDVFVLPRQNTLE